MCKAYSCIYHKTRGVLRPKNDADFFCHSHEKMIEEYGLKDDSLINRKFVRIEVAPKEDDSYNTPISDWKFVVDEKGTLPEWFDAQKAEAKCREAAVNYFDGYDQKLTAGPINVKDGDYIVVRSGVTVNIENQTGGYVRCEAGSNVNGKKVTEACMLQGGKYPPSRRRSSRGAKRKEPDHAP